MNISYWVLDIGYWVLIIRYWELGNSNWVISLPWSVMEQSDISASGEQSEISASGVICTLITLNTLAH